MRPKIESHVNANGVARRQLKSTSLGPQTAHAVCPWLSVTASLAAQSERLTPETSSRNSSRPDDGEGAYQFIHRLKLDVAQS